MTQDKRLLVRLSLEWSAAVAQLSSIRQQEGGAKLSSRWRATFLIFIVTIVFPSIALAASETHRPPMPGGAVVGALIMWWICSRRKQQPIGGWLLYYFIQLYLAFVFSLLMTLMSAQNYRPSAWEGSNLYYFFLLSTVPGLIIEIAQVIVATGLLRVRDWRWVNYLRMVLVIDLVFVVIAVGIDAIHFQDNIALDIFSLIWPIIWLPYFSKSRRVERVFKTKDWVGPAGVDEVSDVRDCPFCSEKIKTSATLCQYCNREVPLPASGSSLEAAARAHAYCWTCSSFKSRSRLDPAKGFCSRHQRKIHSYDKRCEEYAPNRNRG